MYILVIITTLLMLQKQQSTVWWSNVHTCHNHHLTYAKNSRVLYGDLMYIYVIVIIITLLEIKLDQNFHQLLWNVILGDVHSTKLTVFQITQIYTAQNSLYIYINTFSAHTDIYSLTLILGISTPFFKTHEPLKFWRQSLLMLLMALGFTKHLLLTQSWEVVTSCCYAHEKLRNLYIYLEIQVKLYIYMLMEYSNMP